MPAKRPRVALIGVSGYGQIHHRMLLELWDAGRIEIVACVVINQDHEARKTRDLRARGCRVYNDYREMFDHHGGALDLCFIPTPVSWHARMTVAALAAGANVLVEKPLAATFADVERVRASEESSGRFVAVGFQDLFVEENLELKRMILGGVIGRLREIRAFGMWPRPIDYYRRNNWAGRIELGDERFLDSPVSNAFAHFLNLPLFLSGQEFAASATVVDVDAELFRAQPIENFCTSALRLRTDAGVLVHGYFSHSCESEMDPKLVVIGDAGTIEWHYLKQIVIRPKAGAARAIRLPDLDGTRRSLYERLLAKIADPALFACGVAIAAEHVRCFNLIQAGACIRDVSAPWRLERAAADGGRQIVIDGVEKAMLRAFREGKLLRETGCPWAMAACAPG